MCPLFSLYMAAVEGKLTPLGKLVNKEAWLFDMGEEGVADHIVEFVLLSPPPSGLSYPVVCDACVMSDVNGDGAWMKVDFVTLISAS